MHWTTSAIWTLLAFSQFHEGLAQQVSVVELSRTNSLFYLVYNKHYSFETDTSEGLVGSDIIFYVSFKDNFFTKERYFEVNIYYMDWIQRPAIHCFISEHSLVKGKSTKYTNVFTFVVNLQMSGKYLATITPKDGPYAAMSSQFAPDGVHIHANERINFTVLKPGGDEKCANIGRFILNAIKMGVFTTHTAMSWSEWTTVQRMNDTCLNWTYDLPTWSIEMILHDTCYNEKFNCLNPNKIKKVNISEYTQNVMNVLMPVPTREEEFIIMPYIFPPGIFQICNTEVMANTPIKHCGIVRIYPISDHCFQFMEPMRIIMTPSNEEFMWPLEDLNIIVHDYSCLYATLDKLYTGGIKYTYKWFCMGDVLCRRLLLNTTQRAMNYTANEIIELDTQDTTLTIPKKYMTVGTTVTIWFFLEYAHPLYTYFICNSTENRTITFVKQLYSHLEWRCHHNCWYYANPEIALLVGFECVACVITTANNPTIVWNVTGLNNETLAGDSTPYLEVTDFGNLTARFYSRFFIRLNVSYTTLTGEHEEIRMGKRFLLARNIRKSDIHITSDFLFETGLSKSRSGNERAKYFPQFSLNMDDMYYYVGTAAPIPIVTTISRAYDADEIFKAQKPATAGIDGKCTYVCRHVDQTSLTDGNYSHCTDCTKYVTCSNGYLREWDCTPDMEAASKPLCMVNIDMCASNLTVSTDKKQYIKDYIITRTLWAPQSFVLELLMDEDNTTTIQVELSSYAGLRKFKLMLDVFFVPARVPPPSTIEDVERLWLVPHETHEMFFIDTSYLIVIARALEITQRKRNPLNIPPQPSTQDDLFTNKSAGNESLGGEVAGDGDTANRQILQGSIYVQTVDASNESTKVLGLVETIIDALLSQDEYPMIYSNVDLYMAALTHILNIYDYSFTILDKALRYINLVHEFHVKNLTDPGSDDDMIRRKLESLHSLTKYFLRYRNSYPLFFQMEHNKQYETRLLETLYIIVEDISERQGMRIPGLKSIVHKDFTVIGAWFDASKLDRFLHINMGLTDFTIDVHGLLMSAAFDYVLYTFVNVAAYTSASSPLPCLDPDLSANGPIMHLHIEMKHPLALPLSIQTPGIYDIRYQIEFESKRYCETFLFSSHPQQDVTNSTGVVDFDIYTKKDASLPDLTSDCYFVRVAASNVYATTVTLKAASNVTFGVKIKLSDRLKDGLKTIYEDEIILPHHQPEKTTACHGIDLNQYSVFFPALSLQQEYELKHQGVYYVVIRVITDAGYRSNDVSTSDLVSVRTDQVSINCLRSTCLQMDNRKLIPKFCRVTHCTGGLPQHVTCRCDRGYTFTVNSTSCISAAFDVDRDKELRIQEINPLTFNYIIPAFVATVWFIFVALFVRASTSDRREKMMGKTLALQGVFSPYSTNQYLMCFVTGFGVGCGTKSVPYMTIVGDEVISPRYKLDTSEYVFANGSEIWLVITVPENIGKPRLIILSTETEGRKLSTWFIKEIYIKHAISGEEMLFTYNTWIPDNNGATVFAVDNGETDQNVVVKTTFGSMLLRLMRNQHPVFSIGYNVPGSRFTKASLRGYGHARFPSTQHVLFCLCAVHILMFLCLITQDLPKPKLVVDREIKEAYSLKVEYFVRATTCALIGLLPIYLIGVLVETAIPIEPQTIEWRQEMKLPKERRLLRKAPPDASLIRNPELIKLLLREDDDTEKKPEDGVVGTETPAGLLSVSTGMTPRQSSSVFSSFGSASTRSRSPANINTNTSVSEFEADGKSTDVTYIQVPTESGNMCTRCIERIFPLPIFICEGLMWVIILPVSYYAFMLGFFFSSAGSLEYVYITCVSFIVLTAIVYPFWLTGVALVNTVLYLNDKPAYGSRNESEHRVKSVLAALPAAKSMARLNVVTTRTRTIGEQDKTRLSEASMMRSQIWCRELIMKKTFQRRKHVTYNTWETLLFVIVILVIINGQIGDVWQSYYQTEFVARSLRIRTISEDLSEDKAFTYEGMWDHLLNMLHTIVAWKSNSSTASFTILSAVKIRQVRAQPYKGNCEEDFQKQLFPRCNFDVEKSIIETRTFANRWNYPIPANSSRPGPYSYQKPGYFSALSTPSHTYPDGGYTTLFSWWSKEPVMLNYLHKNMWVDNHTKALIVNMNFINVDSGLATVIEHVYEFRLMGIFMYTYDLYTFPLKLTQVREFSLSCLVMFLTLMTAYFIINETSACYQMGISHYFLQSQSWFLLCERVLSVAVLAIFFWLQTDRKSKLRQVHLAYLTEKDGTLFIDFHIVSITTFALLLVSSMLVIMCLIKMLLRFREYEWLHTFVDMIPAVGKITYIPFFFIIAFGFLGCLLFQTLLGDYKSIYTACTSVTILLLQSSAILNITDAAPIAGTFFVVAVYCIMFYLVLNYFIVLLNEMYSELKRQDRLYTADEET